MKQRLMVVLAVMIWLGGVGALRAAPLDDVLNADRAFAAAALRNGARAAFVAYAAPDAMMFREGVGPVKGHAAIAASFSSSTSAAAASTSTSPAASPRLR